MCIIKFLLTSALTPLVVWNTKVLLVYGQNGTLQSLNDIIANDPNFSTLNTAITASGLNISGAFDTDITLFAPNNDAFAAISAVVETLTDPQYIAHLQNVLLLHVVDGEVLSTDLEDGQTVTTINEEDIEIDITGTTVSILSPNSNATVVAVDTLSTDGVLHTIDTVLLPEFVTNDLLSLAGSTLDGFSILTDLLNVTGLIGLFTENTTATIFAPTDDAFLALGDEALDYYRNNSAIATMLLTGHVITPQIIPTQNMAAGPLEFQTPGGLTLTVGIEDVDATPVYTINNATIVMPNVLAINGIIHALSSVLAVPGTEYPPVNVSAPTAPIPSTTTAPVAAPTTATLQSFNEIIANDINLSTLNTAITASGLNISAAFDTDITLFAPNNDAFAAISDVVTTLTDPQYIAHLQNVLLLHVVEGQVLSTDLMDGQVVDTINMEIIEIDIDGSNVTILSPNSNASVVAVDTLSTDGVLHTIDAVLLPDFVNNDLLSFAGSEEGFSILVELLNFTGLTTAVGPNLTATVFAPTDDAFMNLGIDAVEYYKSNIGAARALLAGHVISPQIIPTQNMMAGPIEFNTAGGTTLMVTIEEDDDSTSIISINNATIVTPNVLAINGIIHALSSVLVVPGAEYPPVNGTAPIRAPVGVPTPTAPVVAPTSSAFSTLSGVLLMSSLMSIGVPLLMLNW